MSREVASARTWLARINALPMRQPVAVMNVCGGHERSLTRLGLRDVLPPTIRLVAGPGCPVCVCPEADLAAAIAIAQSGAATLVTFGDMLRVPINAPKGAVRSLAAAKAAGADVRPIGTPQEAVALARAAPERQIVFFVAGFETTTAPVAAMLAEGVPDNLSLLLAARRTWPAVDMLLRQGTAGLDALIAPGHVATVMGAEEWRFIPERYHLPVAVAGFSAASLLAGLYAVLLQIQEGRPGLDNCYAGLARPEGNTRARAMLAETMQMEDAHWRGIGVIPASGFGLRGAWRRFDARARFAAHLPAPTAKSEMPPGCDCAAVVLGQRAPDECRLYGRACTPQQPVGPCMVSDEGACHIWWQAGRRAAA